MSVGSSSMVAPNSYTSRTKKSHTKMIQHAHTSAVLAVAVASKDAYGLANSAATPNMKMNVQAAPCHWCLTAGRHYHNPDFRLTDKDKDSPVLVPPINIASYNPIVNDDSRHACM